MIRNMYGMTYLNWICLVNIFITLKTTFILKVIESPFTLLHSFQFRGGADSLKSREEGCSFRGLGENEYFYRLQDQPSAASRM